MLGLGVTLSVLHFGAVLLIWPLDKLPRFHALAPLMGFLMAVLASAIGYGLWPSLFACLASVLAYNFFFLPPLYTFTIADPENVVALFFFAAVALIASYSSITVTPAAAAAKRASSAASISVSALEPSSPSIATPALTYTSEAKFDLDVLRYRREYRVQALDVPLAGLPELNKAFAKIVADEKGSAVFRNR